MKHAVSMVLTLRTAGGTRAVLGYSTENPDLAGGYLVTFIRLGTASQRCHREATSENPGIRF